MMSSRLKPTGIVIGTLLIFAAFVPFHNAEASHFRVVAGKLTDASKQWPLGGEEVGSFKMKIVRDVITILKIEMDKPPTAGYKYVVGFNNQFTKPDIAGTKILKTYEFAEPTIRLKDIPMTTPYDFLLVNENNYSKSLDGIYVGVAPLPDATNLSPEPVKFEHNDTEIVSVLDIRKQQYNAGERIEIGPKLVNISNESVTIVHGSPPFIVSVYDTKGTLVWLYPYPELDIAITAILKPGVPYGWDEESIQRMHDIRIDKPGEYFIISYSHFSVEEDADVISDKETLTPVLGKVYSNSVPITILP